MTGYPSRPQKGFPACMRSVKGTGVTCQIVHIDTGVFTFFRLSAQVTALHGFLSPPCPQVQLSRTHSVPLEPFLCKVKITRHPPPRRRSMVCHMRCPLTYFPQVVVRTAGGSLQHYTQLEVNLHFLSYVCIEYRVIITKTRNRVCK